jgi:hypothetical protein
LSLSLSAKAGAAVTAESTPMARNVRMLMCVIPKVQREIA